MTEGDRTSTRVGASPRKTRRAAVRARAGWLVVGLLLAVGDAAADPKPTPVDITPYRNRLVVLRDQAGGIYVASSCRKSGSHLFYGTGTTLYEQVIVGRFFNGRAWEIDAWAPRVENRRPGGVAYRKDGSYAMFCGDKYKPLTVVTGAEAKHVLDTSKFVTPLLVRRPHRLARDDRGVYYYVDSLDRAHGGKGFRVFVGKRGAMKELPLEDVAQDTAGEVFSTRTGNLRFVVYNDTAAVPSHATWIRHGRHTHLVALDVLDNEPLIFGDLGVYRRLGTVCAHE